MRPRRGFHEGTEAGPRLPVEEQQGVLAHAGLVARRQDRGRQLWNAPGLGPVLEEVSDLGSEPPQVKRRRVIPRNPLPDGARHEELQEGAVDEAVIAACIAIEEGGRPHGGIEPLQTDSRREVGAQELTRLVGEDLVMHPPVGGVPDEPREMGQQVLGVAAHDAELARRVIEPPRRVGLVEVGHVHLAAPSAGQHPGQRRDDHVEEEGAPGQIVQVVCVPDLPAECLPVGRRGQGALQVLLDLGLAELQQVGDLRLGPVADFLVQARGARRGDEP